LLLLAEKPMSIAVVHDAAFGAAKLVSLPADAGNLAGNEFDYSPLTSQKKGGFARQIVG
jgi:hypothetical protein